jgi:hypothetical protein
MTSPRRRKATDARPMRTAATLVNGEGAFALTWGVGAGLVASGIGAWGDGREPQRHIAAA